MTKSTRRVAAGVLVIAAAVGFLIYRGIATTGAYYLTVAELKGSPTGRALSDRDLVRVGGEVVDGTIRYDQRNLVLEFSVRDGEDGDEVLEARYEGPKPDAFEPDIEVLLEGTYDRARNLFLARNLLVKCPSKYQSEDEGTAD